MSEITPYYHFSIDKTEGGLTITVPSWRVEQVLPILGHWGLGLFLVFLCFTAWPFHRDTPVEPWDYALFSVLVALLAFVAARILWYGYGKRVISIDRENVLVDDVCLIRFRRRVFPVSALLRIDRNVEKVFTDKKPAVLTLDLLLEKPDDRGIYRCPLPCVSENEFSELSQTLRSFLPPIDPVPQGYLVRVENEEGLLRLYPKNMSGDSPWWLELLALAVVLAALAAFFNWIEFKTAFPASLVGSFIGALLCPLLVFLVSPVYRRCHRIQWMTLSENRFEMQTSFLGISRIRRIDFPRYGGVRRNFHQIRNDGPVCWTVEILVGNRWFRLDTVSLHEQAELAATVNRFLGIDEEKVLGDPTYFKFQREEKEVRFPVGDESVDVNGTAAVTIIVIFVLLLVILFSLEKFPTDLWILLFFFSIPISLIATVVWARFGKCVVRTNEKNLEIFRRFPLYRPKPFVIKEKEIEKIRILPPFADVANTPWGSRATGYSVEIVRKENKSVVLPCGSVEEQIWLVNALKKLIEWPAPTGRSSL